VKLTVVHVTSKGLYPLEDERLGMYELLAESLRAQTFTDFDVVCVDACNPIPRHELQWWLKDRVCFVRPRETPWRRLNTYCAASARNSGLVWARGETIVSLDDCYELPPTFLERVAELSAQGLYAWPYIRSANGEQGAYAVAGPQDLGPDEHTGGILAYPLAAALVCNGWDERFDGIPLGEDWDFGDRLRRAGVRFVRDPGVYVVDPGRPKHVAGQGPRREQHRCHRAVRQFAELRQSMKANEPWSDAEMAMLRDCEWRRHALTALGGCVLTGNACEYPRGSSQMALDLMISYEQGQWFDLIAERRVNGVV